MQGKQKFSRRKTSNHQLINSLKTRYKMKITKQTVYLQYYRPALHKEEASAGEIYLSLQKKSGVKLSTSNVPVFGRFLKKLGVMTQLASRGRLYLVVEK